MVETFRYLWRQRARFIRIHRPFRANPGDRQSHGSRRQGDFIAKVDIRHALPVHRLLNKRLADVRSDVYTVLAFPNVAAVSAADLYKGIENSNSCQ